MGCGGSRRLWECLLLAWSSGGHQFWGQGQVWGWGFSHLSHGEMNGLGGVWSSPGQGKVWIPTQTIPRFQGSVMTQNVPKPPRADSLPSPCLFQPRGIRRDADLEQKRATKRAPKPHLACDPIWPSLRAQTILSRCPRASSRCQRQSDNYIIPNRTAPPCRAGAGPSPTQGDLGRWGAPGCCWGCLCEPGRLPQSVPTFQNAQGAPGTAPGAAEQSQDTLRALPGRGRHLPGAQGSLSAQHRPGLGSCSPGTSCSLRHSAFLACASLREGFGTSGNLRGPGFNWDWFGLHTPALLQEEL